MESVKANVLGMTYTMASAFQTRNVRAFCFGTQRVSYRHRVSRQMSSGQRVLGHYFLRTQSVKANFFQTQSV